MASITKETIDEITLKWGTANGYPDWLVPFMLSYAQMPVLTKAANECGKSYFVVKEYIDTNPEVSKFMKVLQTFVIGDLTESLLKRAMVSDSLLQFALKSYNPEQFGSKIDVTSDGLPLKTYVRVSPEDWPDA